MSNILVFNKPYQVLSQFNDDQGRETLAGYIDMPECLPCWSIGSGQRGAVAFNR